MRLSALVVARDEEARLPGCLASLSFADEVLVVLDRSTDSSAAIARAAADPSCLMVNRNSGSGTRILLEGVLAGARPPGHANQPRSHNAVAAAVAQGRADWGLAIEPVARDLGLGFLPLAEEHYDFFLPDSRRERPAVRAFLAALESAPVRARLAALGYST